MFDKIIATIVNQKNITPIKAEAKVYAGDGDGHAQLGKVFICSNVPCC